jgi:hypothetical protein
MIFMIGSNDIIEIISMLSRELKEKYGEASIDKLKYTRSKYIIYIRVNKRNGKIIISKNCDIRVYTGLAGQDISIKRILTRIIQRINEERMYHDT